MVFTASQSQSTAATPSAAGRIITACCRLPQWSERWPTISEDHRSPKRWMQKMDIAITPLAIPMLSGPGAISTVILLHHQADGIAQDIALCGCIFAVSAATYFILRLSAKGAQWLNPIAMKITTRIMGLLLAAVASQFMINALRELKVVQ